MTPPILHTHRLTLGPATPAHAEAFIAFCATEASHFIGGPANRDDAWEGVARAAGMWTLSGFGPFWVTQGEVPVGRVGIYYPIWRAEPELAWVIYPAFQGQGFATEAALAAREWACGVAGLAPLMSVIDAGNAASVRVAEKLGAVLEAPFANEDGKPLFMWRHPGAAA